MSGWHIFAHQGWLVCLVKVSRKPGLAEPTFAFSFVFNMTEALPGHVLMLLVAQSCLTFATLWTVACQAPLSIGLSKQ